MENKEKEKEGCSGTTSKKGKEGRIFRCLRREEKELVSTGFLKDFREEPQPEEKN